MKKTIYLLLAVAMLSMASCKSTNFTSATKKIIKKYEPQASVTPLDSTTLFEASIQNLYPTADVKKVAPKAQLIWDISEAWLKIKGEAMGRLEKDQLINLYKSMIKQIDIWKK